MEFYAEVVAPDVDPQACSYVVVSDDRLLCRRDQPWRPLTGVEWLSLGAIESSRHYLGRLEGRHCFVVESPVFDCLPEAYLWAGLRSQLGRSDEAWFQLAGRAMQIATWYRQHRFCGQCGRPTIAHRSERAKVCETCNHLFYPRLSPCVIAVITRGDHCLLAHNANFPQGYYSALAGFIEAGETVEQCLHREVKEEVGIGISNLRYFGSQPWPFPGQLMLGFHADHASGEIDVDGEEILDARWWRYDQLPLVPTASTLSGQLIEHFVAQFN